MSANNSTVSMYEAIPVVSELNKVPGFDPLKYLRKTKSGWKLDLKIKKLWFRLKYPSGRIRMTSLKITDQLAIIEARVYFDKNDTQAVSSFTAQRENKNTPGGLYIEAAQYSAMDEALSAAGFGIQFIPADHAKAESVNESVSAAVQKQKRQFETPPMDECKISSTANIPVETVTKQPTDQETAAPAQVITEADKKPSVEAEPTVFTEQNVAEEQTAAAVQAQTTPEVVREEVSETSDTEEISASYTKETPVDEICALMTVEEAGNIIVPAGTCKGWTLSQVADRRPVSLKWYLTGYSGDDNILRAGARIMQSVVEEKKAS